MLKQSLYTLYLTTTGVFLFFQVYNRILLHMKHGTLKSVICYGAMIAFPSIPFILSLSGISQTVFLANLPLLTGLIIVETVMRFRQKSLRASWPGEETVLFKSSDKSRVPLDTTETMILRSYSPKSLPWQGPPLNIIHISDFHVDFLKSNDLLIEAVNQINRLQADFVFLTGDFTDDIEYLPLLSKEICRIESQYGIFGCLGNHDYWGDFKAIEKELERVGVIFPGEHGESIQVSDGYEVILHNVDYPYVKPWRYKGQTGTENSLRIVLSHTPDNFHRIARSGADMVFSGHLHGGQWRVPIFGTVIAPSSKDRLFDMGHFKKLDTHLFLTAGIGNVWIPFRLNCPAEILQVVIPGGSGQWENQFETDHFSQVQKESLKELQTVQQLSF